MPWDQGQPTTPGPSPRDGMSHRLAVQLTAASSSYLFRQEGLVVQVYLMSSGHSRVDLQISPHQTVGKKTYDLKTNWAIGDISSIVPNIPQ